MKALAQNINAIYPTDLKMRDFNAHIGGRFEGFCFEKCAGIVDTISSFFQNKIIQRCRQDEMLKIASSGPLGIYGDKGRAWLAGLPHFLSEKEKALNIKIDKPFQNLTFHYVAHATSSDGTECVFKCGIPGLVSANMK